MLQDKSINKPSRNIGFKPSFCKSFSSPTDTAYCWCDLLTQLSVGAPIQTD